MIIKGELTMIKVEEEAEEAKTLSLSAIFVRKLVILLMYVF